MTSHVAKKQKSVNVSLMRSKIKNHHIDSAVDKVKTKLALDNVELFFSKSELIAECIESAFESVLLKKGLTVHDVTEILKKQN